MKRYTFFQKHPICFISIILLLNLCQCSSGNTTKKPDVKPIPVGVVVKDVVCMTDADNHYAIYIPKSYKAGKTWPAVYMLDSHGGGNVPVEKYKDLAEKYGYIIIGSHNSKNGLPMQTSNSIVYTLLDDTQNRLAIDKKRIYLLGFSGGARVAGYYALANPGITGVIACGAGLSEVKNAGGNFNYFGIVGDEDFNYSEFKMLDKTMDSIKMKHQVVYFDGEHAWPPASVMEEAFLWLEVNAMKDKSSAKNDAMINGIKKHFDDSLSFQKNSGDMMKLDRTYKEAINFLENLADVKAYKNSLSELEKSPKYIEAKKFDEQVDKTELKLKDKFSNAFENKEMEWWNREVRSLNNEKNKKLLKLNKRVLNHCSIMAYMAGSSALSKGEMQWAQKFLQIYVLVDPDNSEAYYLNAELSMMNKNADAALSFLEQAVQYKFTDLDRLQQDPVFEPIRQDARFQKILEEIAKKK